MSHAFSFLCFANHQEYFTIDWGVAFRSAFTKILYHRCMYQCTRYFGRVAFFLSSLSFPPTINVSMLRRSLIFNHQSSMTRWFALPAYKPYCSLRVACADFIWWQLQSLTGHRPPQPSALHVHVQWATAVFWKRRVRKLWVYVGLWYWPVSRWSCSLATYDKILSVFQRLIGGYKRNVLSS